MNRLLLPAGLVLAGLVAFDNVFDQRLRLAELERESVCKPEQLTQLRARMQAEHDALTNKLEERLAQEHAADFAQTRESNDRIEHLQGLLAEQQATLDEERLQMTAWEQDWDGLDSTTLRRRLFELQARLESQRADIDLFQQLREDDCQRVHKDVSALETKLDRSIAPRDCDKLWDDLVGPVVQLIGDTTVGSGVLLESRPAADGGFTTNLLTAWHVVRDIYGTQGNLSAPVPTKVYAPDGTWRSMAAHLLAHDVTVDLALLVLDTNELMPCGARLATRSELSAMRTFDGVYAVGCPLGNDPIPTVGEVASTHHEIDGSKYWMISAPTYIGNSGGGIYAARTHDLIGIFSKIYTHGSTRSTIVPHMGLATPLTVVYDWLDTTEYAYLEAQGSEVAAKPAAMTR